MPEAPATPCSLEQRRLGQADTGPWEGGRRWGLRQTQATEATADEEAIGRRQMEGRPGRRTGG